MGGYDTDGDCRQVQCTAVPGVAGSCTRFRSRRLMSSALSKCTDNRIVSDSSCMCLAEQPHPEARRHAPMDMPGSHAPIPAS